MPSTQDILVPFDPTAYPTISGAQLLQYASGLIPYTDTGFTINTTDTAGVPDVPNAAVTTKWKKYLWIRKGAVSVGAYVWNDNAAVDPTYLKWISINLAGIGVGTITGAMIADNTITDIKIISLDWSKLTGVPTGFTPSGAAGGDLTGIYPNPTLGLGVVTGAKIAANAVTHTNLGGQAVEVPTDIKPSAVGLSQIRTNAGATACEWFVPTTNAIILQQVNKMITAADSTATVIPYDGTIPLIGEGKAIDSLAITVLNAASKLRVTFNGVFGNSFLSAATSVALFNDANICVQAAAFMSCYADATGTILLDYQIAHGQPVGTVMTFKVRFGPSSNTSYFLRTSALNPLFTGAVGASFTIQEVA